MCARAPHTVAFAIRGPIARADLPGLCRGLHAAGRAAAGVVLCDVHGVEPDAVTVDALSRLRSPRSGADAGSGCEGARELAELVDFIGLPDVLGADRRGVGPARRSARYDSSSQRQAEEREQRLRVEEELEARRSGRPRSRAPAAPTGRSRSPLGSACTARTRARRSPPRAGQHARAPAAGPGPTHQRQDVVAPGAATARTAASTASRPRGSATSARPCRSARRPRRNGRAARRPPRRAAARVGRGVHVAASSVARARWRALLTDATLVSSSSADLRRLPAQHLAEDQDGALRAAADAAARP